MPVMTFFLCREQSVDELLLPALAAFTFPVNENLNWPSVSGANLLALQDMRLCPVICSTMCDDLGRCWPPRMNEGLRYGGMNSSPIFTTAEAVHDRRLPTGQPLWVGTALVTHKLHRGGVTAWEFILSLFQAPSHPVCLYFIHQK